MNDLISRKHFIERVQAAVGTVEEELTQDFKDGVWSTLLLLKSEPEAPQWIPVSEQLPIIETDVLLTAHNGKCQFVGWLDVFGKWHADDEEVVRGYEPLAWMPLPQGYQWEDAND